MIAAEGRHPGPRRPRRVPVAHRRREPEGRALDAPARPRVREDRDRGGARPLPRAPAAAQRSGGAAVGRAAADARAGDGVPRQARRPHDRRAVARSRAARRRAAPPGRAAVPRPGRHRHPRRAVGERRAHHRRQGVLHGEGRDPVPRAHRRAARAPRPPALDLPRGRRPPPKAAKTGDRREQGRLPLAEIADREPRPRRARTANAASCSRHAT